MNTIARFLTFICLMGLLSSQTVIKEISLSTNTQLSESLESEIGLYKIIDFKKERTYIKVSVKDSNISQEILVAHVYSC